VRPGTIVAERFEIEELAGSGGMGSVWRARDRLTGQPVAVKVLHGANERAAARFTMEARALGDLRHPGIVRYVAHGTTPAGDAYLAMDWLEGEDLASRLLRAPLPVGEAIELAVRAAEALGAAHRRGVVHRDVKPANLFLVDGEVARTTVLDFGVARIRSAASEITATGATVGTPSYMAPEQVRGSKDVDARADVFALGCVLYRCITGKPPFAGADPSAVAAKVVSDEVPPLRDAVPKIPPSLDMLVSRMLSKDPAMRPSDGAEVAAELASLTTVDHVAGAPSTGSTGERALGKDENRPLAVVMAGDDTLDDQEGGRPSARVRVEEIARRHGARLEAGDDGAFVLTLVGAGAATDLATKAARCALAMRDALRSSPIALATGRGLVRDRAAMGEAIERAGTLLRDTDDGSIRVDAVTTGLLGARFDVSGDARGFVLRGEPSGVARAHTLLGRPTPFVGRERDLAMLEMFLDECAGESVARAVVVTAPAGVGKSRLREELVSRARKRDVAWTVLSGAGDPMRAGSPWSTLAPALREAAGIRDDDRAQARFDKLRARVARELGADTIDRIAGFLGEIANAPKITEDPQLRAARADPMLMGDNVRRAFEDFLSAETSRRPVLVVLDDLHWGDQPSLQLLDGALRKLAERPLIVVGFARPEIDEMFPRLWSERGAQTLRLGELTKRASEKLARAALGESAAKETIDRIVARSAGNAFFLEELVRATAEGRGEALPDTVLAMAQARLGELDPEERRVLRAASVFGEEFTAGGVVPLLGGDRDASRLDAWLSTLVDREVLVRREAHDVFAFRHALLRESAYAMLTEDDRALGHRLAASWLETRERPDPIEVAEHHEKGGTRDRAVAWWLRAAEESLEANDFAASIARAERGVACEAKGALLGELRSVQASAHKWRGANDVQARCAEEALALLPKGSPAWCSAAADLCAASDVSHTLERMLTLEGELREVAHRDGGSRPLLLAWLRAGVGLVFAGLIDRATKAVEEIEAIAAVATPGDKLVQARVESVRATASLSQGDVGRALVHFDRVVDLFLEEGDLRNGVTARMNLAFTMVITGRAEDAVKVLRAALVDCERMGLTIVEKTLHGNLAFALGRSGHYEEGRKEAELAAEAGRVQGDSRAEGAARIYLAAILGWTKQLERAEIEARRAVHLLDSNPTYRPAANAMLARILLGLDRKEEAAEHSRIAYDELVARGGVEHKEYVRLARAEILHALGDLEGAKQVILAAKTSLLDDAQRIADPEVRARFLEGVPENARTIKLANRWCEGA
jgi:tetratricopeptide (TPR) repeat protein